MSHYPHFINNEELASLASLSEPEPEAVNALLQKGEELVGLTLNEAAQLLAVESETLIDRLTESASKIKERIYGQRLVLFAPLYTSNLCSNNCLYCGFRTDNSKLKRVKLSREELAGEVENLISQGHKRVLMLCGEDSSTKLDHTLKMIETAYSVSIGKNRIRRINVEIAPLSVEEFKELKGSSIGTYACFQESYHPELYKKYHPSGEKADYNNRLYVMHRAMEGGIDDVGIGALFGLAPYKFDVLALLAHSHELERLFDCGPHTVSIPRLEPADGATLSSQPPYQVSDKEFKKLISVIRIALPYTGIILSTRESASLRKELFQYGISQISAGSRTNPGGYHETTSAGEQFSLGDHRPIDEVIESLIDDGFIPSFCTGCYRQGRVGQDFMDMAKPGLIREYCQPNGILSFAEYLEDFASQNVKMRGYQLIEKLVGQEPERRREELQKGLAKIKSGGRDLYH